jgi:hypothetical protein
MGPDSGMSLVFACYLARFKKVSCSAESAGPSAIGRIGLYARIAVAMVLIDRNQYRRCPGRKWGPPGDFAGMM